MEHLDVAGKGSLWGHHFNCCDAGVFRSTKCTFYMEPTKCAVMIDGRVSADTKQLTNLSAGLTNDIILLPINCNGVHWCSIMVNIANADVQMYDPMCSSSLEQVQDVAKVVVRLLPAPQSPRLR